MTEWTEFNPYKENKNAAHLPNCILRSNLHMGEKLLIARLFQYAGKDGKAFPRRKLLAKELNFTLRTLDNYISLLKQHKLINTTQKNTQSPSIYTFIRHPIYTQDFEFKQLKVNGKGTDTGCSRGTDTGCSRGTDTGCNHNRIINNKIIKKDLIKIKSGVTALPSAGSGGIIRDSKKPCIIKKTGRKSKIQKTSKLPSSKYTITSKSFSNYLQLKKVGATSHKDATQAYFDTMDKLHALFSPKCKEPYSMCYVPEQFIDYNWTLEELIAVFEFHLNHAESINKKKIKSIGQFIVTKGFNGRKSWSPLLYWHQQMNKTNSDDLDKYGSKLYKSFKRAKIKAHDIENPVLNKLGQQIQILEKYYEFTDDSNEMYYPFGIVDYFTKIYVLEKLNDTRFKIYHINKKTFVRDFTRTALQRNFMKKKQQWMDINLDNVELGQKPTFN